VTAADCPRRWEAEALEDERLDGVDRASFDRHLATCEACVRELAALEKLRDAMRALPESPPTPIARHRLRAALLREANRRVVSTRGVPWNRLAFGAVAIVGVAVATTLFVRHERDASVAQVSATTAAPKFDVEALGGAVWRSRTTGATTSIELADGVAEFSVPHLEATQRFVVSLPDGEIEVRGTRFTVVVDVGRTTSVTVTDGRVAFRRSGEPEIVLRAGDRWSKVEPEPLADKTETPPTAVATSTARRPRLPAIASTPPSGSAMPSAGARFGEAMASFHAGDYARADAQLAQFAADFPNDPRCEDAAFLRAVARWRVGDRAGAASLARAYLSTYPNGLRRIEAQHIVDGTAVSP
jgi:ferric-dicitrate binding protein FerR (iron transport regulator)